MTGRWPNPEPICTSPYPKPIVIPISVEDMQILSNFFHWKSTALAVGYLQIIINIWHMLYIFLLENCFNHWYNLCSKPNQRCTFSRIDTTKWSEKLYKNVLGILGPSESIWYSRCSTCPTVILVMNVTLLYSISETIKYYIEYSWYIV